MTEINADLTAGDAAVIADLAERAASIEDQVHPVDPGAGPFLVRHPNDVTVDVINPERYAEAPYRKRGHVQVTDVESLCQYVNAHKEAATTLWAVREQGKIVAVLDDHGPGYSAGWGEHRATMTLRQTPEWKRWFTNNGQMLGQVEFAELVEDGASSIVEPPAADMLELAQTFNAARSVDYKSGHRLASGESQLIYNEVIDASAGKTAEIRIPETFTLGLSPFEGTATYRILARLRWRLNGSKLFLGYKLDRPEELVRQAFHDVLEKVYEDTGITPHSGTPRAER